MIDTPFNITNVLNINSFNRNCSEWAEEMKTSSFTHNLQLRSFSWLHQFSFNMISSLFSFLPISTLWCSLNGIFCTACVGFTIKNDGSPSPYLSFVLSLMFLYNYSAFLNGKILFCQRSIQYNHSPTHRICLRETLNMCNNNTHFTKAFIRSQSIRSSCRHVFDRFTWHEIALKSVCVFFRFRFIWKFHLWNKITREAK